MGYSVCLSEQKFNSLTDLMNVNIKVFYLFFNATLKISNLGW